MSRSQGINPDKLNNIDKFENMATIGVKTTYLVMACPYKPMKLCLWDAKEMCINLRCRGHHIVISSCWVYNLSFASRFLSWHFAPPEGMHIIVTFPHLFVLCTFWHLRPIIQKKGMHTLRGSHNIDMPSKAKFFVIYFITFKWVVINHQKGGDCKCNHHPMRVLVINDNPLNDLMALWSTWADWISYIVHNLCQAC